MYSSLLIQNIPISVNTTEMNKFLGNIISLIFYFTIFSIEMLSL